MPFLPSFFTVLVGFAPLPAPFIEALEQIQVETAISQASIFRLRFELSKTITGDWDVLEFNIFRPLVPITIQVNLGLGLSETIINGYVHSSDLGNRNEPGQSSFEVVGMDATSTIMNLLETPTPWPNLPDSAIAAAIFGKYGILPTVLPTPATRTINDTTTIQRTTDIRFLKQMARRHSFECFVQPDPFLGRDIGYFGPPRTTVPHQGVLSVNLGLVTNLGNFQVRYAMLQPTSVLALAVDSTTKAPTPGIAVAALEPPLGREPALQRIVPPPVARPSGTDAANAAELMAVAQSAVNRSSRCIQGSGDVDGLKYQRVLRPGLPVLVRGAGREHSGAYYVTQVSHSISRDSYIQRFSAWRNAVGLTGAEVFIDLFAAVSGG